MRQSLQATELRWKHNHNTTVLILAFISINHQVLECRRGCEAMAFDSRRSEEECTAACVSVIHQRTEEHHSGWMCNIVTLILHRKTTVNMLKKKNFVSWKGFQLSNAYVMALLMIVSQWLSELNHLLSLILQSEEHCRTGCQNYAAAGNQSGLVDAFDMLNSVSGMVQQTVAVAPMQPPNLTTPECMERAGVYHVSLDSLTSLNASFNDTGYTTYILKVQSLENSSLSTHIWLVRTLPIIPECV